MGKRNMLFNSWAFIPFLVVVRVLDSVLPFRWQNQMPLAVSCLFYGVWDWRFLGFLFGSTAIDSFVGHAIDRAESPRRRKWLLALTVTVNLGMLRHVPISD